MHRRKFVATATGMALTGAIAPAAQADEEKPVVGFLAIANRKAHVADMAGLRVGLREVGLIEGQSITIEERYAEGDRERVAGIVDDFLALGVRVFLVPGPAAARAVRKRTETPVVAVALPYSNRHPDLFHALNKPGGSITGFSLGSEELSAKRIQILREAVPEIAMLAIMHNASDPIYREWGMETETAAHAQGLKSIRLELNAPDAGELERLMQVAVAAGAQGMMVIREFITATMGGEIASSAAKRGIAALSEQRDFCQAGGLLSYGANVPDLFRRSAVYIDKILKGAHPGGLPIQRPTAFDLVVNLKTADLLHLTIPPAMLVQATEVIE